MRRGAPRLALLSALLYGALVLHSTPAGPATSAAWWVADVRPFLPPVRVASYTVAANAIAFVAVALLAGSLAERLQRGRRPVWPWRRRRLPTCRRSTSTSSKA